ncbi:DUF2190 family protein [Sphingomonas sp. Xoc002]|jgi:hypothetical protein|uniref:DUF2190 family protein n=1 Tax=Sphingomonas sp. Xoc002 TaxID=2837624 RepID=UPI003D175E8A
MKNFLQPGHNVPGVAPYPLASGNGYLDGAEFAIASNDAAAGASVVGVTNGVFSLPKAAVAITRKTVAYWDNTNRNVTNSASGNTKIGLFRDGALAGDATVAVKLIPSI